MEAHRDYAMTTTVDGDVVIVEVRGALGVSAGAVLLKRLRALLVEVSDLRAVELDVGGVSSVDVVGLHAIVRGSALAQWLGRHLVLRNPPRCLLRLLPVADPARQIHLVGRSACRSCRPPAAVASVR